MKVPAAALVTLLLLVICSPAEVQLDDNFFMTCCFNYVTRPVPRTFIVSIERTSSRCSKPAVILVTKKGRHICADPQAPWVQTLLHDFQKR
ncbi:C-C motif chemokine 3-like [Patagioenas fasciata]